MVGYSLVMSVVAMAVAYGISTISIDRLKTTGNILTGTKSEMALREALAVGSYLVGHGLILCKEDGWSQLKENERCLWGGDRWPNEQYTLEQLRLSRVGYSEEGEYILELNIDETRLKDARGANKIRMIFDISRWRNDADDSRGDANPVNNNIAEIMGDIEHNMADKDDYVVTIRTELDTVDSNGNDKTIKMNGLLRRPASSINISMRESAVCNSVCLPGQTENPSPQCMSDFRVPDESNVTVALEIQNPGPGPVFQADYQRFIDFNNRFTSRNSESARKDFFGSREVLMPGEKFTASDEIPCYVPQTVNRTVQNNVTQFSSSGSGTSQTSSTSVSQHQDNMANLYYDIESAGLEPARLMAEPERISSDVERDVTTVTTTVTTVTVIYVSPPH